MIPLKEGVKELKDMRVRFYIEACTVTIIVFSNNSTFEEVLEFKYLEITLSNQNSIAEEIKIRLRSGNACYHLVQSLLSSRLLSKNIKVKIYITIILSVFCMSVKLGHSH